MEYILLESSVLQSIVGTELTTEYILTNFHDIVPDYQIAESLKKEFVNLYHDNLDQIYDSNIEQLLFILHKYGINKHYEKILEHVIWQILNLNYTPINLNPDIITDIIYYNKDFSNVLGYLINHMPVVISPKDYLFSIPLLEIAQHDIGRIKLIDLNMPIKYGLLQVIKRIYKYNKDMNIDIWDIWDGFCNEAIYYNQFEILKWAYENGSPLNESVCSTAAMKNFEILKWLRENRCPWNDETCAYAALGNNFEILKWACPWD